MAMTPGRDAGDTRPADDTQLPVVAEPRSDVLAPIVVASVVSATPPRARAATERSAMRTSGKRK